MYPCHHVYQGKDIFFINTGRVAVFNLGMVLITSLSDGSHFGEIAALMHTPRTANIRAETYLETKVLFQKKPNPNP